MVIFPSLEFDVGTSELRSFHFFDPLSIFGLSNLESIWENYDRNRWVKRAKRLWFEFENRRTTVLPSFHLNYNTRIFFSLETTLLFSFFLLTYLRSNPNNSLKLNHIERDQHRCRANRKEYVSIMIWRWKSKVRRHNGPDNGGSDWKRRVVQWFILLSSYNAITMI